MRNYFRLFILVACATLPLSVFGYGSVLVNKVWFDTNAQSSGENGIRVHVDFNAKGVRNHKIKILAFFYDGNKARMEGGVKGYRNTDGHVCISKTLDADYDNSHWKDLKMFIPMRALSLSSGTHIILKLGLRMSPKMSTFLKDNIILLWLMEVEIRQNVWKVLIEKRQQELPRLHEYIERMVIGGFSQW
jgi:hypothetical protein